MLVQTTAQRQFIELSKKASVKICTQDGGLLGTGVFVLPNKILTCYHVIRQREHIGLFLKNGNALNPNGKIDIKNIQQAPDKDLALIELNDEIAAPNQFCLMLSDRIRIGDNCYSFGYSKDFYEGDTALTKYVDKVGDSKEWLKVKEDRIINGFSGSGLINLRNGHLVGLMSESLNTSLNLGGIAVPAAIILEQFPGLETQQEQFFAQQVRFKNIYKRLLLDFESIEGVEVVDDLFIEYNRHQKNNNVSPRDFYLATPNAQWWGVINDLTVDKNVFPKIVDFIINHFNHPAPVISLLYGSGGMGKSTTARKLLYHFAQQYQCVWVDDLLGEEEIEIFIKEFLPSLTDGNKKTLVVIDDWGKLETPIQGKLKKLFKKIYKKETSELKFIITGRQQHVNDLSLELQVPDAKTYFNVAEELRSDNEKLLLKFTELFPLQKGQFLDKEQLINLKPFHLLFTIIRALESKDIQQQLLKKRAYSNYFQDIISFDLNELYKDDNTRGFAYALIFLAYLSHTHSYNISKSTFLQIADKYNNAPYSLLKNKEHTAVKDWEVLRFYVSEYISEKDKREDAPEQIQYNKDDFREAILEVDLKNNFPSALIFFDEWKKKAVEEVLIHGSNFSSSVIGFVFGAYEESPDKKYIIETLLKRGITHHAYTKLFLEKRFNFSFDTGWQYLLAFVNHNNDNYYTFGLACNLINRTFHNKKEKKHKKFEYLMELGVDHPAISNGYLNSFPDPQKALIEAKKLIKASDYPQVINTCLWILQSEPDTAIKEAKRLIKTADSPVVVSTCLRILQAEPHTAIKEAKRLVQSSDFHQAINTSLRILEAEPNTAIKEAKRLILQSEAPSILCACLRILEAEPDTAIKEAKRLIKTADSPVVVSTCLRILQAEPHTAIKEAKRLIQSSDSEAVLSACLRALEAEPNTAIKEAKKLILQSEAPDILCTCLRILEAEPETAIKEAKRLIQSSGSEAVLSPCLRALEAEPNTAIKEAKKLILQSEAPDILCTCLKILEAEPEGKSYATEVLHNWRNVDRNVVLRSLNTIPNSQEAESIIRQILTREINDFYLYTKIIQHGYGRHPIWEKHVDGILRNWKKHPRLIVANCLNHFEEDLSFTEPICKGLLMEWKKNIVQIKKKRFKRPNYYFIFKPMAHPNLKSFVKKTCIDMLGYEKEHPGFLPKNIREQCELIIDNNEYPDWVREEHDSLG